MIDPAGTGFPRNVTVPEMSYLAGPWLPQPVAATSRIPSVITAGIRPLRGFTARRGMVATCSRHDHGSPLFRLPAAINTSIETYSDTNSTDPSPFENIAPPAWLLPQFMLL